jgi:leucyl-tRNA synthetase
MGKSLKNVVTPDEVCESYGADTFRVYEMSMGPLADSKPWETRAIVGSQRFLQRLWRNLVDEETGSLRVDDEPTDEETRRLLHRTIAAVRADMDDLSFNTAIARLFELNNRLNEVVATRGIAPREVALPLVLMTAPLAPHVAEELWERLGNTEPLVFEPFPDADPALLVEEQVEIAVQVNGKVRARIIVATDATDTELEAAARADERVAGALAAGTVRKGIVVPGRLVNFVVG